MSGIGNLLLSLRGYSDPRARLLADTLGPAGAGAMANGPGAGVRTPAPAALPGATPLPGQAADAPQAQPAMSPIYDSPPDLMQLYTELSGYDKREKSVDGGLGLLASALVQPRHAEAAAQAFAPGAKADPLSLVMQLNDYKQQQVQQQVAQEKVQRQQAALPAIAKQYGISLETAQTMLDGGQLDDFLVAASKPDNHYETDPQSGKVTVFDKNGEVIRTIDGTPKPRETITVKDDATGKERLVYKDTGEDVKDLGGGLKPTADEQEFQHMKDAGTLPADVTNYSQYKEWDANLKKSQVNINNNLGDSSTKALVGALDKPLQDEFAKVPDQVNTISQLQSARGTLTKGIVAGSVLAPATNEGRKILAQIFGIPDDKANNTDTLMAQMKNVVLPKLKELRPVSDTDLQTVEAIVGGTATLDAKTINQLIDIQEKAARQEVINTNTKMQKRIDAIQDPANKAEAQQAFDAAKTDVPDYDPAFLSHVDPSDLQQLKDGKATPKEFDDVYGPGAAEQLLRK